jgi:conjugative transfer pilus assembly protein TraH
MCVKSFVVHKCTDYKLKVFKSIIILLVIIAFEPSSVNAKSDLLGKLGMSSNYNRPEIWQDQLGNYATGGSLYARTPSSELQLLSFDMPSIDAGCGGININFGGFGYISGKQIETLIKQIGTNALSYAVMLTIKSISPQIADLLENLEAMARFMNSQNINSCQLGASIASGLFAKTEAGQRLGCQARKMGGGSGGIGDALSNAFAAREGCNDGKEASSTNSADNNKDKPMLPEEYNLVWYALSKESSNLPVSDKEFLMSISGTVLSVKGKDGNISFIHKPSLIRGNDKLIDKIIFGSAGEAGTSGFKLYTCDKADLCLHLTKGHQPWDSTDSMMHKVADIIRSMEEKIKAEGKGENVSLDAREKDMLTKTTLPIFKLISLHVALKGHGARYSVEDYAETLAFDYTIGYLDELVNFVYEAISNLEHAQMEGEVIKKFKEELRAVRLDLFNERSKAMNRLHTILSVKQTTRQVEDQVNLLFADYRDRSVE